MSAFSTLGQMTGEFAEYVASRRRKRRATKVEGMPALEVVTASAFAAGFQLWIGRYGWDSVI